MFMKFLGMVELPIGTNLLDFVTDPFLDPDTHLDY